MGLCLGLAGCLSAPNPTWSPPDGGLKRAGDLPVTPLPCRKLASGEPILNEVLARPGKLDLDGDGQVNGRDEAIEIIHGGDVEATYDGVELRVDGQLRGVIVDSGCVTPGQVLVLTGAQAATLELPVGTNQVRLDHALKLPDGGATLTLHGGLAGIELAKVDVPPAGATDSSWARAVDGDRSSGWTWHAQVPDAMGQPASPGRCLDQQPPCMCIDLQKPLCERGVPEPQQNAQGGR
jgi:hypothetical protein